MKATLELTSEAAGQVDGNSANEAVVEGSLWCPAVLPNGTRGHWFFVDEGDSFVCTDSTCPYHGHVVQQCPLHRSFIERINASCTAANCGKERFRNEGLH